MYLRTIKARNKTYLAIVAGERHGNKVKQKLILNLGAVDEMNKKSMLSLGARVMAMFGGIGISNPQDLEEKSRCNWGASAIINELWKSFKLKEFVEGLLKDRRLQFDLESSLKLLITDRVCYPCSKLQTFRKQGYYDNLPEISLQNLYKSLDELDRYQEEICEHIFNQQKEFSNQKVEVIFFDVTTLYFESKNSDDLKNFGYSKDCKFNEVQVVLSLIVSADGRPLSYGLFSGNTYEGSSLIPSLQKLKEKYNINKVIIVADRGMCSFANLEAISKAGFDYIVGAKLRSATKAIKDVALQTDGYESITESDDENLKYKLIEREISKESSKIKEQVVCIWSSSRAKKDKKDRERLIEKAYEMVANKRFTDKRGVKKYLKIKESYPEIDSLKIENDQRWDGYYAISTNCKDFSATKIIDAYHNLWRVEESFRTLKSHFEARPMFHWTPKRISGHILLNFIALVMEKHLELMLAKHGISSSHQRTREALCKMEKSEVVSKNTKLILYSKLDDLQSGILKVLKITSPTNFASML